MITLYGRVPSKKNSRITTRSGRSFPSKLYTEWHKDASLQLIGQSKIPNGSWLIIKFTFPDHRKCDLTNKAESIMDLLVDNRLLEDDNYEIIPNITLQFEGVAKEAKTTIDW